MDLIKEVNRLIDESTKTEFNNRVKEQSNNLNNWINEKKYENKEFSIGLELEAFVLNKKGYIKNIPNELFDKSVFAPELGKHNIEINTTPHFFSEQGVVNQKKDLLSRFNRSESLLNKNGLQLVLDALSKTYFNSKKYFMDVKETEGLVFAKNMTKAPRYYGIDNAVLRKRNNSINFSLPGVDLDFPSLLFESLATSMQVHLQIPDPKEFTRYYNLGIRSMAPLLALSTNSPFLPPSFYENNLPNEVYHENRIEIFEQCVNPTDKYRDKKVRFPIEIDDFSDLTEAVARDETYTACLSEWRETSGPQKDFWEWNYKLREFWRWLRPVIGGEEIKDCCSENSIRLEIRPLPTQPTLKETISLQVITAGLIHGLVITNHPVSELSWKKSKNDFYEVVKNGLDAEIHWITKKGEKTTNKDRIFNEIFLFAKKGLKEIGINKNKIKEYFEPIKKRWKQKITPSNWKINRVREKLDNNVELNEAITEVSQEYNELSKKHELFIKWPK